MRRLTIVALYALLLTASFSSLYRFFSRRFEDFTGQALWIWPTHRISRNVPVVFFAARDFPMPAGAKFAHLKIFAEPGYMLWFNGVPIASRRADDRHKLDVYDLSTLTRGGRNRLVVGVRSANGVGGLIASLDVSEDRESVIVTDGSWRIFRRWSDALPLRDAGVAEAPMLLGEPPLGRWHYLSPRAASVDAPPRRIVAPRGALDFLATIPVVKIVEGVAVATPKHVRATAFDFGFTRGRVRFSLIGNQPVPPVISYRLANSSAEFRQIESAVESTPFGQGERAVTEPDSRSFRYVIVFGGRARAEVVQ